MIRRIIVCILIAVLPIAGFAQKQKKVAAPTEGVLYFSLTGQRNGKDIVLVRDNGVSISKDSLKMVDKITATYKVGQKVAAVKDIVYDSFYLSTVKEPTILQDMSGLTFDKSIWISCLDSLVKKEQVVFQIREITLEDGSKIQNPKLMKASKAVYRVFTNPNFPAGGWESKANHWISMWKEWFKPKDNSFYKMDDKTLELYATGVVLTIR